MSSNGASTSSRIQRGLDYYKTAKISDNAVNVCSPPESNEIVESFFCGLKNISNPAKRSELSTKVSVFSSSSK